MICSSFSQLLQLAIPVIFFKLRYCTQAIKSLHGFPLEDPYLIIFAIGQATEGSHTLVKFLLQLLVPLHGCLIGLHLKP